MSARAQFSAGIPARREGAEKETTHAARAAAPQHCCGTFRKPTVCRQDSGRARSLSCRKTFSKQLVRFILRLASYQSTQRQSSQGVLTIISLAAPEYSAHILCYRGSTWGRPIIPADQGWITSDRSDLWGASHGVLQDNNYLEFISQK